MKTIVADEVKIHQAATVEKTINVDSDALRVLKIKVKPKSSESCVIQ